MLRTQFDPVDHHVTTHEVFLGRVLIAASTHRSNSLPGVLDGRGKGDVFLLLVLTDHILRHGVSCLWRLRVQLTDSVSRSFRCRFLRRMGELRKVASGGCDT